MSKIFISFLGTGNYLTCNYKFTETTIPEVRFVQEACIQAHCLNYDKFLFFNTENAHRLNWSGEKAHSFDPEETIVNPDISSLSNRLSKIESIQGKLKEIIIPDGFTEDEVWRIFDLIDKEIEENDEIVLDITHAFRFIPMIGMALTNYLKVVKKIRLNGIYYGAFETLGPAKEAGKKNLCERDVDVIDLRYLSELQDWTIAAHNFSNFGKPKDLIELVNADIKPILAKSNGNDNISKNLRDVVSKLEEVFSSVSTLRAINVYESFHNEKIISACQEIKNSVKPQIRPLIAMLEERISGLKKQDIMNGFEVVQWCLDFDWLPQAATFLQETLISYVMTNHADIIDHVLGTTEKDIKTDYARRMQVNKGICFDPQKGDSKDLRQLSELISKDENLKELGIIARNLTDLRNDINHCGHNPNSSDYKKIRTKIEEYYTQIKAIVTPKDLNAIATVCEPS